MVIFCSTIIGGVFLRPFEIGFCCFKALTLRMEDATIFLSVHFLHDHIILCLSKVADFLIKKN